LIVFKIAQPPKPQAVVRMLTFVYIGSLFAPHCRVNGPGPSSMPMLALQGCCGISWRGAGQKSSDPIAETEQ